MIQPFDEEIKKILEILHINWISKDERIDLVRVLGGIYDVGYNTGYDEAVDTESG